MTKKTFTEIIVNLQLSYAKDHHLYDLGVDLMQFQEPTHKIIDQLLSEVFNEDQRRWIDWFLYERLSLTGKGKPNKAWKKVGRKKVEICYDIDSLWETVVEAGQQADFDNRVGG